MYASRSRWVDRRLTAPATHLLRRFTTLSATGYGELLGLPDRHVVAEFAVSAESRLVGRTLDALPLDGDEIIVLGIDRAEGGYESAPPETSVVGAGDTLILYGPRRAVRSGQVAG